jgi:hypothetical protein
MSRIVSYKIHPFFKMAKESLLIRMLFNVDITTSATQCYVCMVKSKKKMILDVEW